MVTLVVKAEVDSERLEEETEESSEDSERTEGASVSLASEVEPECKQQRQAVSERIPTQRQLPSGCSLFLFLFLSLSLSLSL